MSQTHRHLSGHIEILVEPIPKPAQPSSANARFGSNIINRPRSEHFRKIIHLQPLLRSELCRNPRFIFPLVPGVLAQLARVRELALPFE